MLRKYKLTPPPKTDILNMLSMSVFVVFKHRHHENGKRSERMNQLHEDLLYVKSLVTAMGNLNQEEVQLRNQNRQIAEQLEALQQKKQTIIQQLQAENPIFPVEYLAVSVMDFVQWELETGQAKNINQAIVHYEANKSRN
jgi:hypothetical protein